MKKQTKLCSVKLHVTKNKINCDLCLETGFRFIFIQIRAAVHTDQRSLGKYNFRTRN